MHALLFASLSDIYLRQLLQVLYLGAASGTTVSHVSDIVGPVREHFFLPFFYFPASCLHERAQ